MDPIPVRSTVRAGVAGGHPVLAALFLLAIAAVFCGALRQAIRITDTQLPSTKGTL